MLQDFGEYLILPDSGLIFGNIRSTYILISTKSQLLFVEFISSVYSLPDKSVTAVNLKENATSAISCL